MSVNEFYFGTMPDGREVKLISITNNNNVTAQIITLGATLQALYTPDRYGKINDVTVGFDSLYGHLNFTDYQGKVVGRYANRLSNARFSVGGMECNLIRNEKDKTCLHSAGEFSDAVWDIEEIYTDGVELSCTSIDGTNGFSGNLFAKVKYTLTENNELKIAYTAVCDKDTIMNFTNHVYFNLTGSAMSNVLEHIAEIKADYYTPVDEDSIPTGEIRSVDGTAFDFRMPTAIGKRIADNDEQLVIGRGYDHNFCLASNDSEPFAVVVEPISGRRLEAYTDLPGVQLYTGNFLDGTVLGKGGMPIVKNAGFCLETQYYPDTPNHRNFPQCTFKAGEEFKSETVFKFSVE